MKRKNSSSDTPSELHINATLDKWADDISTMGCELDHLDVKPFLNWINHFVSLRREWAQIQEEYDNGKLAAEAFKYRSDQILNTLLFFGRMTNHNAIMAFIEDQFGDDPETVGILRHQFKETRLLWQYLGRPMYKDMVKLEKDDLEDKD